MQKLVSLIVPAYNEAANVQAMYLAVKEVFIGLPNYNFELLFIDDGSSDDTAKIIQSLSKHHSEIKYIIFSKNFGKDNALKAGLDACKGEAAITMDADLQHPPSLIPQLIQKWELGSDVVYAARENKDLHHSFLNNWGSRLFYKLLNSLTNLNVEFGISDYRILDKKVVNALRALPEYNPFYRGLVKWVGFAQESIPYTPNERFSGETKYSKRNLLSLALNSITSFSTKPLTAAIYLGFFIAGLALLYIPYALISYVLGYSVSGWASLIVTVAFFGGLQLLILGIIGLYLGKLFIQNKQRPNYIIDKTNC